MAGKGVVTEAAWIDFVFLTKPPAAGILERKAEPTTAAAAVLVTKLEMVPDSFMDILGKRRLFHKRPLSPTVGITTSTPSTLSCASSI